MGKHYGANLWYFFQLFSPFLAIFVAWLTGRFSLWPIVFSSLLIYNLFSLTSDDDYKYFNKNAIGWGTVEMLIKSNSSIFSSPLIDPLLIKNNREIFVDGATEFFSQGGRRQGLLGYVFQEDKRVDIAQALFNNKLQEMMKNKKFDLIIIDEAHYLKNNDSIRGKIMVELATKYDINKIWLLTGTPIANRPMDFFNLLKIIKSPITKNWKYFTRDQGHSSSFGS